MRDALGRFLYFWKKLSSHGLFVALFDFTLLAFSAYLGYAIRLTLFIPSVYLYDLALTALIFPSIIVAVFFFGKQYRTLWKQAGLEDYLRFAKLYLLAGALFTGLVTFRPFTLLPRTSLVIMLFAGVILCGALRVSWRLAITRASDGGRRFLNALIVGAGEAGAVLARDLLRNPQELVPRGFVDDDTSKIGKTISGLAVLSDTEDLPSLIKAYEISVVLVAIPSAAGKKIRELYDMLSPLKVSVRVLPSLQELAGGDVSVNRLRRVSLEDLLGRDPVDMTYRCDYLRGAKVLVTGAGGSIGSEIVRQTLKNEPSELVVLGHGEQSIYLLMESLYKSLAKSPLLSKVRPVIADVADEIAMRDLFEGFRPDVIFHAAAHKHVPLMEPCVREALRVNTFGTLTVSRLAGESGAKRLVMISTDKAVRPSSVMGASKRAAERALGEVQDKFKNTAYMAVRFGNVLGSRGSVVPKFEEQIAAGGPVTITDPSMKRYFMLIPEAVSLVIQAGAIGRGGELFVLDMGEPVLISEMAEMLIRLHGHEPGRDIKIVCTGIRPGEKLFEELFYDPASVRRTSNPKVFESTLKLSGGTQSILPKLSQSLAYPNKAPELLREMVPEYIGE
ncbi:polysaccharide biosynthesis protein CapD [Synergistales bacterium]|nr:polysaccharide biosynthesis protein CapD [Synergistales bacterium]